MVLHWHDIAKYELRISAVINGEASFIEKCQLISEELSAYLSLFSVEGLNGSQIDGILQIIFLPILDISLHSISIRNIALRFLIYNIVLMLILKLFHQS